MELRDSQALQNIRHSYGDGKIKCIDNIDMLVITIDNWDVIREILHFMQVISKIFLM